MYFPIAFDKGEDDPQFVAVHIEMAGEKWLRDRGINEGDRIFGKDIRHLMSQGWLSSKGGTWGKSSRH